MELHISIGIGLVISLFFSEFFGLAAGGLVVPGYMALYLNRPVDVLITLGVSAATFMFVRLVSSVVIVYGKRRTALMLLTGYVLQLLINTIDSSLGGSFNADYQVIGYVIPGLVAIWIDRQGMVETFSTLITGSVMVRLILIILDRA